MSGLADFEKQGIFDFFESQEDKTILIQLAKTLTKNLVTSESLEEALYIVFLHGGSTAAILSKKIITKEILFKYLHKNVVAVSSDFTKTSLIEKTQSFWKEKFSDTEEIKNIKLSIETRQTYTNQPQSSIVSLLSQQHQQQLVPPQQAEIISSTDSTLFPINLLAKKFSEWFFKSYNENILKSEDFWIDSTLQLKMIETSTSNMQEHQCTSSIESVKTLLEIKKTYNLYFNPNLTHEGVQGRLDIHGLVLVICCGTLHTLDRYIGTFESLFGLIRDPNMDNNWKIKNMKLILKSSTVIQQIPSLSDSDTLREILELPEPSGNL